MLFRSEAVTGAVRRILPSEGLLLLEDGTEIDLDDIIGIESSLFDRLGLV